MTRQDWKRLSADARTNVLQAALFDGACEVLCKRDCDCGCEVEPDGRCPCGCPSILLATGLM